MDIKPTMPASSLVELLHVLAKATIPVWLDGGWGVDALLQAQTRQHKDVDIIVCVVDVPILEEILGWRGFTVREGSPPNSLVLADGKGLEVDGHAGKDHNACRDAKGDWEPVVSGISTGP